MKLFKNGVGRPSNETKKKRRLFVFGAVTLSIVAGLLVALLISTVSINNLSGKALGNYSGDMDGDGLVTQKDIKTIMEFVSKIKSYNSEQKKIADMNKDGKITTADLKLAKAKAKKNYTIVFSNHRADNGSGSMDAVELGKTDIKLPKCKFTDEGMAFNGWIMQRKEDGKYYGQVSKKNGWYTQSELFQKNSGKYILFKDEQKINLSSLGVKEGTSVTLYANWKKSSSKKNSSKSSSSNKNNYKTTTSKKSSNNSESERKSYHKKTKKTSTNCPAIKNQSSCDSYSNCKWGFGACKTI